MNIQWIGQSGYIVDLAGVKLVIDPYLSNSIEELQGFKRMLPISPDVKDLQADYIYCTHNHLDHFDPQTILSILELYPGCKIIGPRSVIEHAQQLKINTENLILLEPHQEFPLFDFKLTATPAIHSDPFSTGLLLQNQRHKVYFSGDTEYSVEFAQLIAETIGEKLDLLFVCINGKLGNMNTPEAVQFAQQLNPKLVIPNHYGMFAQNTADPADFAQQCTSSGLKSLVMQINTSIKL